MYNRIVIRALFKNWVACLLVMTLVLTGHSMALARTAPDAAGQMVICVGATTVTVYTDKDGRPTDAPHICPDCLLTLSPPPATASVAWPDAVAVSLDVRFTFARLLSTRSEVGFWSRAPPLAV